MAFTINTSEISNGPGYWNSLLVEILENGNKVGEYTRNYHGMYNTFAPFQRDGKWYAVYSKDYTATRVMSLPDCKDISGENPDSFGFCAVDYYIPSLWDLSEYAKEYKDQEKLPDDVLITSELIEKIKEYIRHDYEDYPNVVISELKSLDSACKRAGTFGFLSGCIWGDDSSWKIRYLDLSDINNIKEDDRFGYIEQSEDTLKDNVSVKHGHIVIKTGLHFTFNGTYQGYFSHDKFNRDKPDNE